MSIDPACVAFFVVASSNFFFAVRRRADKLERERERGTGLQASSEGYAMKVTIKGMAISPRKTMLMTDWHAVAVWQWKVAQDDVCGICRIAFDGTCADCKAPGDECPLSRLPRVQGLLTDR